MISANYVLLDAARLLGKLEKAQELNKEYICLYREKGESYLSQVAPYLFPYSENTEFADWLKEGIGESWGIFVKSSYSIEELFKHFRQFLMVKTEEGQELYFRFYDPRVLSIFLPTCDNKQLSLLFNKVQSFIVEVEEENMIQFTFDGNRLISQQIGIKKQTEQIPTEKGTNEISPTIPAITETINETPPNNFNLGFHFD